MVEEVACDICSAKVPKPSGYLLNSSEVINSSRYWQRYYEYHKDEFQFMGISSYEGFRRNSILWNTTYNTLAGQRTPWLVCDSCIAIFNVDRQRARRHAEQWWESGGSFQPANWWEFWKK